MPYGGVEGPRYTVHLHPPDYTPITHAEWEGWRYPANIDHELLATRLAAGIRTGAELTSVLTIERWNGGMTFGYLAGLDAASH